VDLACLSTKAYRTGVGLTQVHVCETCRVVCCPWCWWPSSMRVVSPCPLHWHTSSRWVG
jgi:hypothetical protein